MNKLKGYTYAICAALLNSLIGVFSVKIMQIGLAPYAISFYKCLIALIITMTLLIIFGKFKEWTNFFYNNWRALALCAFFGFFILYFFETNAYKYSKAPTVVFFVLGSATITTFILKNIFNKSFMSTKEILICLCALIGLILLFDMRDMHRGMYNYNLIGVIFAIVAGIGYGLFLTYSSKLNIGSGLIVINTLMLFGSIYSFIPFIINGFVAIPNITSLIFLMILAFFPTIGGFWCTTKALDLLSSESVQLLELTEPIFSLLLAWLFLSQTLNYIQLCGCFLVITAIYINKYAPTTKVRINTKKL